MMIDERVKRDGWYSGRDWAIEDLVVLANVLRQKEAVARDEDEWVDVNIHKIS